MTGRAIGIIRIAVWVICLSPLLHLILRGVTGGLGANPIESVTLSTGTWTLVLLLATLSVSPLKGLTRRPWLVSLRRVLGLSAFSYASLHFLTYVCLDKFFDLHEISGDVLRRPFITAGIAAYLLMVPLAATSTARSIARIGAKRWQILHMLVYVSSIAGVVHFWWKVKADIREPAVYASILALLLGYRLVLWIRRFLAGGTSMRT